MKHMKKRIVYKKERVVLSDILPYEIPIIFSNRYFYQFLTEYKIEVDSQSLKWKDSGPVLEQIIKLMFNSLDATIHSNSIDLNEGSKRKITIPFTYKISHHDHAYRELNIIHPLNQLDVVDFYEKYKHLLVYYCTLSPFSIRRAQGIAKYTYYNDKMHIKNLSSGIASLGHVEIESSEYENLRSFFVYKDYSNVYQFYESKKYHRCEEKYNYMIKFDVSKCFDSIYTHTIEWALLNRDIVKETLGTKTTSFGKKFDILMQNLNYNETNGIVIGPEFSRIFAELIFQRIDRDILSSLFKENELKHKRDYVIFRYVDDYFAFYNDETTKEEILRAYQLQLKHYRLCLNDSKTLHYNKPIITEITIAKQQISALVNDFFIYRNKPTSTKRTVAEEENEDDTTKRVIIEKTISIDSSALITKYKTIIWETKVKYNDVLNYTLAAIESKLISIIAEFHKQKQIIEKDKYAKYENEFIRAIGNILEFTFFIYSVSPHVNTTLKLCRILEHILRFTKKKTVVKSDNKHFIRKIIFDKVRMIMQKNSRDQYAQVETLYLLIALSELGYEYNLHSKDLYQYLDLSEKIPGQLECKGDMNYLTIVVTLFYIKNKSEYTQVKKLIEDQIKKRLLAASIHQIVKNAELVILLFDILSCPFLDESLKIAILVHMEITDSQMQQDIIRFRRYWFIKWSEFDYKAELNAKKSQEVYS